MFFALRKILNGETEREIERRERKKEKTPNKTNV
jgi:hypothetical protein